MKLIVNDANILIDLVELELLSPFFSLPCAFFTTSLVFDELEPTQQAQFSKYIESDVFRIEELTGSQLAEIRKIQLGKTSLSVQDCSAFFQAATKQAILITSDNALRKFAEFAEKEQQEVHGHLWVFDQMVEARCITGGEAIEKLTILRTQINPSLGLPEEACAKRLRSWTTNPGPAS